MRVTPGSPELVTPIGEASMNARIVDYQRRHFGEARATLG